MRRVPHFSSSPCSTFSAAVCSLCLCKFRPDLLDEVFGRDTYFMSIVLTHISPPSSTGTMLPSGFFIISLPSTSAANPHHPALGIV